jgi:cold shock CspA family protein
MCWFDGSMGYGYIDAEEEEGVPAHYVHEDFPPLLEGDQVAFFSEHTVVRGPQAIDASHLE